MRKHSSRFLVPSLISLALMASFGTSLTQAQAAEPQPESQKEWTFLIFLNGNNNLDRFGTDDMNEMEAVGSTDAVNVVVQWASLDHGSTRRVLVQKDNNPNQVTSPTIENMGNVDMGDWRNLVEFIRWGVAKYPAKRYFINVWNHGSGWHMMQAGARASGGFSPQDISFDDNTGNYITTKQLGDALREAAAIIGHKVDIYGSDACLMAMAEVAHEMSDAVDLFVGSEEVEPAEGWPYDAVLKKWNEDKKASPVEVAKILSSEYIKSYKKGSQGDRDVTFSVMDLNKIGGFNAAIRDLGKSLLALSPADRNKVISAMNYTQSFTYGDYGDLVDFLGLLDKANVTGVRGEVIANVKDAVRDLVIANETYGYDRAHGIAIWLPTSSWTYESYIEKYNGLRFQQDTQWADALKAVLGIQ